MDEGVGRQGSEWHRSREISATSSEWYKNRELSTTAGRLHPEQNYEEEERKSRGDRISTQQVNGLMQVAQPTFCSRGGNTTGILSRGYEFIIRSHRGVVRTTPHFRIGNSRAPTRPPWQPIDGAKLPGGTRLQSVRSG